MAALKSPLGKFLSQKANRPDWDKRCSSQSGNTLQRLGPVHLQSVSADNLHCARRGRGAVTGKATLSAALWTWRAARKLWRLHDSSITRMCVCHVSAWVGVFNLTHADTPFFFLFFFHLNSSNTRSSKNAAQRSLSDLLLGCLFSKWDSSNLCFRQ